MENAMESWLRCNKCYRLAIKTSRPFVLTQCQHVFCSKCVVDVEKQCPECQSLNVRTVPLTKPLPEQLGHYFERVGVSVQKCLEASRFQKIQMTIAMRRFDEIQERYEEMKKSCHQSATQMKSLVAAYAQQKEINAKKAAEIAQRRSMASQAAKATPSSNFMRPTANNSAQTSKQRTLDYVAASSQYRNNRSCIDTRSSSLSSSRSSLVSPMPVMCQPSARPVHQHMAQGAYQDRPRIQHDQEYRCRMSQTGILQYPNRVISSHILAPPRDGMPTNDNGWMPLGRDERHSDVRRQ